MPLFELFLIAIGLSMDAFAVAVSKGLSMSKASWKNMLIVGLYFGFFQAVMPLSGYLIGSQFADKIVHFDHWIAFILLAFIGGKMIIEGIQHRNGTAQPAGYANLHAKEMLPLAIATSIDALAVGVSFAFLGINIVPAIVLIGLVTLVLSMLGVKLGNIFGIKYKAKAEICGGIILVLMGLKILIEHLS